MPTVEYWKEKVFWKMIYSIMCFLILFSLYSNDLICFQRGFEFIKKNWFLKENFLCEEKSGNVFGNFLKLWYYLASYCYSGDNAQNTDFLASKKAAT